MKMPKAMDFSQKWDNFKRLSHKFSRSRISLVGLFSVVIIITLAIFAPLIAPYPEHAGAFVDYAHASIPPCREHLFGTDIMGRDVLSRTIFALRGALLMAIGVIGIVTPIGVIVGLVAGYNSGSLVDTILMRISDVFLALPSLVLALAVAAVLRPTLFNAMLAVCVSWWPWYARLTYGLASSIRNETFVQAAQVIGASHFHIIFKEVLPNCLSSIFTKMALDVGWVILIGASLSFVGLGEQPPTPALGTMVADGARYLPELWWVCVFPALVIVWMILSFNLFGDGVRDALSPEEA
ncbi:MAG: ABC transporter permease [Caldiserica bacterium]|jgi:peptide/nickel transport system permease protein|nr:ABC transporter permease [Caldisericota bacterium]